VYARARATDLNLAAIGACVRAWRVCVCVCVCVCVRARAHVAVTCAQASENVQPLKSPRSVHTTKHRSRVLLRQLPQVVLRTAGRGIPACEADFWN
jgi:hypothetical protein